MWRAFWQWATKRSAKFAGIPLRDPALVSLFGQTPSEAGVDVTEYTALNCSAYWAGVNVIAQGVAGLPCMPYEGYGSDRREAREAPAYNLCTLEPNPETAPFTFFESLTAHDLTWGNCYAEIERVDENDPDSDPIAIWQITPNRVTPQRDERGQLEYEVQPDYDEGGEVRYLKPWQMLHVPGLGFDGVKGYSVIHQAKESIGLSLATERFGAAFFGRGAIPGGWIKHPGDLGDPAKKNLRESFESYHRGPGNFRRIGILDEGMEFVPTQIPPEDGQFLQTRQFTVVEIARWLNMPPHLLRDLTFGTYSNIEQQGLDFLTYTLRPWLYRWQQELRRKLIPRKLRHKFYFGHTTDSLLMADIVARFNAYNVARNGGWYTLNDILRKENMPVMDNPIGNARLIPANMNMVMEDGTIVPGTSTSNPTPAGPGGSGSNESKP